MVYKVIWSLDFQKELHFIYDYIFFHLQEPITAKNNLNQIISKISSLSFFPERYPKVINSKNFNIRKLRFKKFIIIYQVNRFTMQVYILHIFHGTQNYINLI